MGDGVKAEVDEARRLRIRLNHSATHLMHAALRDVLGTHVAQKGSLVNDKALRFDFSHFEAMKPSEIRAVEDLVNAQIRRNLPIETNIMDIDAAKPLAQWRCLVRNMMTACEFFAWAISPLNCVVVLTHRVRAISACSALYLSPALRRASVVLKRSLAKAPLRPCMRKATSCRILPSC